MRNIIGVAIAAMLAASMHAEPDASRVASAITSPFITGYTLTRSRAAELGSLGRLWDGMILIVVVRKRMIEREDTRIAPTKFWPTANISA